MAERRPLVTIDGGLQEMPDGDTVDPDVIDSYFEADSSYDPESTKNPICVAETVNGIHPTSSRSATLGSSAKPWNEVHSNNFIGPGTGLTSLPSSAELTGYPTSTTPASSSDNTRIATTEWVNDRVVTALNALGKVLVGSGDPPDASGYENGTLYLKTGG
jgi:hypothetical protein